MEITYKKRGRKPKQSNNITKTPNNKEQEHLNNQSTNMAISLNEKILLKDDFIYEPELKTRSTILWTEKYKPTSINDIIGNKKEISTLKQWLLDFYNNSDDNYELNNKKNKKNSSVVISGGHGVGKNMIIDLLLKEIGYKQKNIYSTNLKNKNIVNEIIQSCTNINNLISNNKIIRYAVIINNTENITITSEKDNLLDLYKQNKEKMYFPLIFISNLQHSKLLNNLKKISLNITISYPSTLLMKTYIQSICRKEQITFSDSTVIDHIINFCQYDMRRLLFVLQDLYFSYKSKITPKMFKAYQQTSQKKNIDIGLKPATYELLDSYKNINYCYQLYETEKVLLPLMVYENYYKKLLKQNNNIETKLNIMANITNSISIGDVIETNIYSDQNWYLQEIHGFFTCINTSYMLNKINDPTNKINYDIDFSLDLNRTSSKKINKKKNISPLQTKFIDKSINDILYINKIFIEISNKNFPKQKKDKIINELKSFYALSDNDIDIATKIDKTNINHIIKK